MSRASYLTKENLFLDQFGPYQSPRGSHPRRPPGAACPGSAARELLARQRSNSITGKAASVRLGSAYGAVNYGLLLAGAVRAMIPCIVVYVALQRFYVRGLVSGALKG